MSASLPVIGGVPRDAPLEPQTDPPDAAVTLDRAVLDDINLGQTSFDQAVADGKAKITGNSAKFDEFVTLLDRFEFWFNIVTP